MTIPEDFKTRLKIAKSKIKKQVTSDNEKKAHLWGSAFKLGTRTSGSSRSWDNNWFILDNWFDTKPWFNNILFLVQLQEC